MKTKFIASALLVAVLPLSFHADARCVPNTIEEAQVSALPDELTLSDLVRIFGNGCLGGMTAVTYQFQGASGNPVWFWLKNEPEPAITLIQKSAASGVPPDVGVFLAVAVEGDGREDTIIWPKALQGRSSVQVLHDEYFGRYAPRGPADPSGDAASRDPRPKDRSAVGD